MDNKTNDANDVRSQRQVLDEMLADMRSGDEELVLAAIADLGTINFSSDAIARQLEKLALGENAKLRAAALNALKFKTSKMVAEQRSIENRFNRSLFIKAIDVWESDGLLEPFRAEVIRRRYDFDMRGENSAQAAQAPLEKAVAQPIPATVPTSSVEALAQSIPAPASRPAPVSAAPRLSLMQVLLSETSIKIYLYLGAFFVIAAAAFLAALVEAARLPVLLVATIIFAGGAIGLKKRLPQPSFALAIVFSFLLPIDANVIAEQLSLSTRGNETYWTLVFLIMTSIWALGTWFYESRLFSVASFVSLSLGALRFGEIFGASADWNIFSVAIANIISLFGARFLKQWKDQKFAQPIFLLTQLMQIVLLAISFGSVAINQFESSATVGSWIASALTWLLAASFYIASDLLTPFLFFPWMAVASLLPVSWLFLSAFDASAPVQIVGFAVWGIIHTFASEFIQRKNRPSITKYHYPLLTWSLPLFCVAVTWGLVEDAWYGFAAFLSTGIAYTIIHTLRPRWYVWLTALLAGLGAYFTFFALPFMEKVNVSFGYQLLGAALLLLIPELFFKEKFSFTRQRNWPPMALGAFVAGLNLLITLVIDSADGTRYGSSAIIMGVYALLFAAYAIRFQWTRLGYFGAASAALSVLFALNHFHRDGWLPALTALSVIYYAAGFILARREQTKAWGTMLINSGLALGTLLSLWAGLILKETGGWYALIIAALFSVEMFTRKNGYLEIFVESVLSIALVQLLNEFEESEISRYLFALSLLWLTCDVTFKFTFHSRKLELPAKIIGGMLTLAATFFIIDEFPARTVAICFGIYALFFAAYAWLNKNPLIGYASTVFLALTVYFGLEVVEFKAWIFPQIALATVYYAAGFILRRMEKAKGWDLTLLFSGLGLGTLVALAAPGQPGELEKAIPIAIAATFYAAEAFARKNVWLGFPANILYLIAYFVILNELKVDEPQFFTVGAAALGLLQHYLLRRAGSKRAAFITGLVSQLVLLGASYIQMVDTGELKYFFLLFFQALVVLLYGIVVRSRSLIIAPISFAVLAVVTVLYNALKDISLVFIIGVAGIVLLALGILAVVMRERITDMAERFSDWDS